MDEVIELTLDSPDGVIDCRLEPQTNEGELAYSATILYPHTVNGYSRSDIYCHTMRQDANTNSFVFEAGEEIHPKIRKLEEQLSEAITSAQSS